MTPDEREREDRIRATQRSRARVTAWVLGTFVVLMFAITIVKIRNGFDG